MSMRCQIASRVRSYRNKALQSGQNRLCLGRFAQVYAGPWTPDIMAMMPGGSQLQDASLRVMGLRLMIRQTGLLLVPFIQAGQQHGIWTRLLTELALIDFVSLEEAVFTGIPKVGRLPSSMNGPGRSTPV
jgi:hypothetical protein